MVTTDLSTFHWTHLTSADVRCSSSDSCSSSCSSSSRWVTNTYLYQLKSGYIVYQTLVLPVLTCACETWTLSAADTRRLEAFHMKCQIARIRWQDHIRNTEVTTLTGLSHVSESIIRRRNSLFGHVKAKFHYADFPETSPRGSLGDVTGKFRGSKPCRDGLKKPATSPRQTRLCRSNGIWERARHDATNRLWHIDQSRVS